MRLLEYQAKQIFKNYGIPIPKGEVAKSIEEVEKIAEKFNGKVVLKAQVLVGGRGKSGGVRKATSVNEAKKIATELFGYNIKGHIVKKLLVEEMLEIKSEFYAGFTIDRSSKSIVAILSTMGGMDVEEVAAKYPQKIAKQKIDPRWGLWDYNLRNLLKNSSSPKELWSDLSDILRKLYNIMISYEAELVEINPLALTPQGLVAADARLNIDDNAIFRKKELFEMREITEESEIEKEAIKFGLNYVQLKGNVGIIANGAGMAMATMDLIKIMGGEPANFLDVGGGASKEVVEKAIEIITKSGVKSIFINIFGGITRCDEVAKGIVDALNRQKIGIPIIVRLSGTNEEEGKNILKKLKNIIVVNEMEEGAKIAVDLAR
ncbi:MAG: ADP-forming succinate--CoA ligase subunit beta [Archaeoglobales archaeon]|nr:ADP-forming succinate--CoA ligase subunit beta [Archaeoglobales archaeon]